MRPPDENYSPGGKVDIYDTEASEWRTGQIQHTIIEEEEHYLILMDSSSKSYGREVKIARSSQHLAPYMTHTVDYSDVEVLPVYNRHLNEEGAAKFFGMPKLLAIGTWCTCSQIAAEVVNQIKAFCQPDSKSGNKIMPFMNIAGNAVSRGNGRALVTSVFDFPKIPGTFTISMVDLSTDTCAICGSRMYATQFKTQSCKGCDILDHHSEYIKDLVNHFRNVAICVDWKNRGDYVDPIIKGEKPPTIEETKKTPTLEDCIDIFTSAEKIPKYECDRCKKEGTAELQVFISKLPDILIVHLKRFLFADNFVEKLDFAVDFPLEKLNMGKWLYKGPNGQAVAKPPSIEYDLYAITNHLSYTAIGGHYTAFIHSGTCKDSWVECDDTMLQRIVEAEVKSKDAYLLFYKRRVMSGSNIINLTYQSFT